MIENMMEQMFDTRSPNTLLTEIEATPAGVELMARRMARHRGLLAYRTAEAEDVDADRLVDDHRFARTWR